MKAFLSQAPLSVTTAAVLQSAGVPSASPTDVDLTSALITSIIRTGTALNKLRQAVGANAADGIFAAAVSNTGVAGPGETTTTLNLSAESIRAPQVNWSWDPDGAPSYW